MADNATSNDTSSCVFPNDPRHTLVYVISGTSAVSAISSTFAIGFLIFFRLYKQFKYRLLCHLLLSVTVFSIVLTFELVTIDYNHNDPTYVTLCIVVGFFVQCTVCIQFLFVCTFVLFLTIAVFCHVDFTSPYYSKCNKWDFIISIPWFIPLLYSWIPFLHDTYGLAGAWCWIRIQNEKCETYVEGIIEQFVLWYGPLAIFSVVNTIMIIVLVIQAVRLTRRVNKVSTATLSELSLIPYLVIYQILAYISLGNRLYRAVSSSHSHTDSYGLWIAHALSVSNWGFFASLYFCLYLLLTKKCRQEKVSTVWIKWFNIAMKCFCMNDPSTTDENIDNQATATALHLTTYKDEEETPAHE